MWHPGNAKKPIKIKKIIVIYSVLANIDWLFLVFGFWAPKSDDLGWSGSSADLPRPLQSSPDLPDLSEAPQTFPSANVFIIRVAHKHAAWSRTFRKVFVVLQLHHPGLILPAETILCLSVQGRNRHTPSEWKRGRVAGAGGCLTVRWVDDRWVGGRMVDGDLFLSFQPT